MTSAPGPASGRRDRSGGRCGMGQAEPSTWYHTLRIGKHAAAPFYSTVLHVPSLMTKTECEALIAAADAHLNVLFDQHVGRHGGHAWPPMHRLPLAAFGRGPLKAMQDQGLTAAQGAQARRIVDEVLFGRVLELLERREPDIASACFGACSGLASLPAHFKGIEPSINVYTAGGFAGPHQDHQALTVLAQLSPSSCFEGGGTAFWPEEQASGWMAPLDLEKALKRGTEVVVRPEQGDVLLWGANLPHAGVAVESGTRHVLVGSFSLGSG
jgi:hypothetical protein